MAHSFKHTPVFGHNAGRSGRSEKSDKRINNRRLRARNNTALRTYGEYAMFFAVNELSNPWNMAKDGKAYWKDCPSKEMRK